MNAQKNYLDLHGAKGTPVLETSITIIVFMIFLLGTISLNYNLIKVIEIDKFVLNVKNFIFVQK